MPRLRKILLLFLQWGWQKMASNLQSHACRYWRKVSNETWCSCLTHNNPLDLYCTTCEVPICYHCTVKDHKKRNYELVSEAHEKSKTEIQERVELLEKEIKEERKRNCELQKSKTNIERKQESNSYHQWALWLFHEKNRNSTGFYQMQRATNKRSWSKVRSAKKLQGLLYATIFHYTGYSAKKIKL